MVLVAPSALMAASRTSPNTRDSIVRAAMIVAPRKKCRWSCVFCVPFSLTHKIMPQIVRQRKY